MIPAWLSEHIASRCKCGAPIYNNDTLTDRHCSNPVCKYHTAMRVESIAKILHVDGVGPAKALEIVEQNHCAFACMAIPYLTSSKPVVSLYEVAQLACIPGHSKDFKEYCDGFASFDDMFAHYEALPDWIIDNIGVLRMTEKYCVVKPPLAKKCVSVMLTGEVHGCPSRDRYIAALNTIFGKYIQVVDVGRRKTGVDFLIKEEDAPHHSKTDIARARGIPMITPSNFILWLRDRVEEMGGEIPSEIK